jgi:histidine triad (HIT) family protein
MDTSHCIFCKLVKGEIPSFIVYEDEHTIAFSDIHPVAPGHTLVIPKVHAANIFSISKESWSQVQETVRKVAGALEKGMECDGINLMMNNREHAGQVVDHAHVHLIPRYKNDGLKLWPHGAFNKEQTEEAVEKIKAEL